jgi:murein DD-endopeptidase MepM/ murein hydrolase activator NlpD
MKFNIRRKKYYYSPEAHPQLHEIKWFRLKIMGIILVSVIGCLTMLLTINHFFYGFLGLGYTKIATLTNENRNLHQQLNTLTSRMKGLEATLDELSKQGNQLRLLVDMSALDDETKAAGVGGTVTALNSTSGFDSVSQIFNSAMTTIDKLTNMAEVQNQSYKQVFIKYEYNKGLFAALPAIKPMEGYYSRRGFGVRMHPILGMFKTHEGLDIINDVGTKVVAAGDGTIEMAGQSGGGYGLVVLINHGYGYQTLYGHLSRILVREGQHVKRGDTIAKSGRTGLVSGPHLHYEVRYKGIFENPADYFLDDVTPQNYRQQITSH